ncbi:hypothetical protein DWB67_12770 [Paracoccus sp. JM45]|nr:hypothetical protein DWB67_12770 [Paracoccus sp. JM45]
MKKVVTIGEILVEIVATTKGDGFYDAQPLVGRFPSGATAILVDQLGKLGTPCAIISREGDDDFGHLDITHLRQDIVDVSGIEIATGSAFVRYRDDGIRSIAIKRGSEGASLFERGVQVDAGPIAVQEIAPTGTGDSFLSFWLKEDDPELALRYDNAASARAVARLGPLEGTSTRPELDATLLDQKGEPRVGQPVK